MKKIFYSIIAAAAIFTGCNREIIVSDGTGSISLDLKCSTAYNEVQTKAPQTDEEIINNLVIDIFRPYDGWGLNYPAFSEIKGKVIELGSGDYEITASSPEKKDAAFNQPIFIGTQGFKIKTGEVKSINLTCSIANLMVSVVLSDNFVRELSDYTVTVSNGKGFLTWTKTSEEVDDFEPAEEDGKTVFKGKNAGYFSVAPLTIKVDGHRSIDGTEASTTYSINTVKAADHHIVRLDAHVTGSADFNITISTEVNPIDQTVVVPGFVDKPVEGDKPSEGEGDGEEDGDTGTDTPDVPEVSATAPKLIWAQNETFANVELPMKKGAKTYVNGQEVGFDLVIEAPEAIREFKIYVKSPVLTATIAGLTAAGNDGIVDGVATMDMINDDVLYGYLGEGLPMKDKVLDKTSVSLSLSELVPLINEYLVDIKENDEHIFKLHVVDAKGQILEQAVTIVSVAAE